MTITEIQSVFRGDDAPKYDETVVDSFLWPNCYGENRTIRIKRNGFGRFRWCLLYQDNPAIATREHSYSDHSFDSAAAAVRSAKRLLKRLAQ